MPCARFHASTYAPQPVHRLLVALHSAARLVRVYSQNLDGLELLAGLPRDALRCMHGSMPGAESMALDDASLSVLVGTSIRFFDDDVHDSLADLAADMHASSVLLVLGSSLKVAPARDIVSDFAGHRILVTNDASLPLPPRRGRAADELVSRGQSA